MLIGRVEDADQLVHGGDAHVDDGVPVDDCARRHIVVVAGEMRVAASRFVLGEVDETIDPDA